MNDFFKYAVVVGTKSTKRGVDEKQETKAKGRGKRREKEGKKSIDIVDVLCVSKRGEEEDGGDGGILYILYPRTASVHA